VSPPSHRGLLLLVSVLRADCLDSTLHTSCWSVILVYFERHQALDSPAKWLWRRHH
jgi:hypothetical protein